MSEKEHTSAVVNCLRLEIKSFANSFALVTEPIYGWTYSTISSAVSISFNNWTNVGTKIKKNIEN